MHWMLFLSMEQDFIRSSVDWDSLWLMSSFQIGKWRFFFLILLQWCVQRIYFCESGNVIAPLFFLEGNTSLIIMGDYEANM